MVVLGDSLTAGYGLPSQDQSFPALLQQKVNEAHLVYEVVNMGVSGDTTAGGLRRLDWALDGDVKVLVVALGGNDGLRGLGPAQMRENLSAIVDGAARRGAQVLICGMEAPPNLGGDYTRQFRAVYGELAREQERALSPIPAGRRGRPARVQSTRRHPSQRGRCPARRGARLDQVASDADRDFHLMIQLRGVSKTVPSGGRPLTILHPIDLDVPDGQTLAIVGPSGSGKSTLLGLMAGLDAPSSGRIEIDGTDITSLGEDELARLRGAKIGFVFQFFHLIAVAHRARERAGAHGTGRRSTTATRGRQALLEEVGLTGRGHHYPSQLSGGEQQRVAIARALANEPRLLLADEPTGNLDTTNGQHVVDILLGVNARRGTTLVLVTHDLELAAGPTDASRCVTATSSNGWDSTVASRQSWRRRPREKRGTLLPGAASGENRERVVAGPTKSFDS